MFCSDLRPKRGGSNSSTTKTSLPLLPTRVTSDHPTASPLATHSPSKKLGVKNKSLKTARRSCPQKIQKSTQAWVKQKISDQSHVQQMIWKSWTIFFLEWKFNKKSKHKWWYRWRTAKDNRRTQQENPQSTVRIWFEWKKNKEDHITIKNREGFTTQTSKGINMYSKWLMFLCVTRIKTW